MGDPEQGEPLRRILRQSTVTNHPIPQQVLHDVERALHLGTDAGLSVLQPLLQSARSGVGVQLLALSQPHALTSDHRCVPVLITFLIALAFCISISPALFRMQQGMRLWDVVAVLMDVSTR